MSKSPSLITVVIPVLDAVEHLPHQLRALAGQDYDRAWELVIADNGSRDGSREVATEWLEVLAENGVPGRVVDASQRRGASFARNAGARAVSSRWRGRWLGQAAFACGRLVGSARAVSIYV